MFPLTLCILFVSSSLSFVSSMLQFAAVAGVCRGDPTCAAFAGAAVDAAVGVAGSRGVCCSAGFELIRGVSAGSSADADNHHICPS